VGVKQGRAAKDLCRDKNGAAPTRQALQERPKPLDPRRVKQP